ncbi:MAG: tetratricopeptide repeat protein [Sarcina sp.]
MFYKKNIPIDELKEKEEIKKFEIQILEINKSNLCFSDERNFVLMKARIKFFLSLNECESLILEFKKLYDFVELDILYIDVLEQLNNSTEAEKIYESLVNQEEKNISIDLVIRGIFIKYNLEKYDEVKRLYEKYIDFTENTSQATYYYGLTLIKTLGAEKAKNIIAKKILCEDEFDFLLLSEVHINEKKTCESYLNKLQLKIDGKNYFNLYIADIYYRLNEFDKAYNVLLEGASINKIFFKRLISLASKTDLNSEENNQIFKIYIERYKTEVDSYIGEYIYMLLVRGKRYIQAQVLARKMYEAKKNIYWTNNYLEMKLVNEELDGIDELIKSVQSSNESKYIINAAMSYMKQGLFELCKEVCFKAYFKIQTNEEFVLLKIGTIGLEIERFAENISGNQQVGSEFILTLGDIGGQVKKYFFTNENILSYNLKILNDIEVCSFSNDIFIEVLDKGKGEKNNS